MFWGNCDADVPNPQPLLNLVPSSYFPRPPLSGNVLHRHPHALKIKLNNYHIYFFGVS